MKFVSVLISLALAVLLTGCENVQTQTQLETCRQENQMMQLKLEQANSQMETAKSQIEQKDQQIETIKPSRTLE